MKKIGFKNFRRFKDFPMIELGGCTFLVGPNNSGKSTLLKAMVLIENNRVRATYGGDTYPFLRNFGFASWRGQTEHLYLGDFMSNLNDNAQEKEITFSFQSGNTDFSFVIDGSSLIEDNPSVLVDLKKITAYNSELDIRFEWDDINEEYGILQYTFNPKVVINQAEIYVYEMSKVNEKEMSKVNEKLLLNESDNETIRALLDAKVTAFRADIDAFIAESKTADTLQTESVKFWANEVNHSYSYAQGTNLLLLEFLRHAKETITRDFRSTTAYKYIETHNVSHKVLLNPEDKNDYLAQTVLQYLNEIGVKFNDDFKYIAHNAAHKVFSNHENPEDKNDDLLQMLQETQKLLQYSVETIVKRADAYKFVIHWMKELKIGVDFIVKPIYNEAYIVDIEGFDGKTKSIGHLGTGSIQLFILLLRIAMAISSHEKVTLYIEEPEQNLHPALQSKLAEMFYEVWKKTEGRVEFVVETHSEYIIRKTQVFVAEQNYKDENELKEKNPFKVYYFPCDETPPYEMTYRKDGKFSDKFRPGFFDEAANLAFKIF